MYTFRKPLTPQLEKLVYFALILSTFIYCLVVWVVMHAQAPMGTLEQEFHQPIVFVLMLLSLSAFVVSLSLRNAITRWAFCESCCIYGIVAAFVAHDWRLFAMGWVLSLVAFVLARPAPREA